MAIGGRTFETQLLLRLRADASQAKKEMKEAETGVEQMSAAAKRGALVAGAAITALAVQGVRAFIDLDTGMREVFTLMPGVTTDAMDTMTEQVREFSKEFAVTTTETVPALYQALSAGVPPDNVFTFMETAAKAARGGVTSLETAVDGLTSVVNAYGEDVISAAEASDTMFTTVRLGKTNFEELSRYLFQVVPIAAELGIEFDQVGAALATLTAQGTPTRVAATQLRQALAELGKEGSIAFGHFEDATGKTFPEFIAGGGTIEDAMVLMGDRADLLGTQTTNLFGSIEAGMGASALASETGAAKMGAAMDEMEGKAGASDEAFGMMSEGIGFSMDQLSAMWDDMVLQLGESLMPALEDLIPVVTELVETVGPLVALIGQLAAFSLKPYIIHVAVVMDIVSDLRALWDTIRGLPTDQMKLEDMFEAEQFGEALRDVVIPALQSVDAEVIRILTPKPGAAGALGALQGLADVTASIIREMAATDPATGGLGFWIDEIDRFVREAGFSFQDYIDLLYGVEEAVLDIPDAFGQLPALIRQHEGDIQAAIADVLDLQRAQTEFEQNLQALTAAGFNEGFVQYLRSLGPEGAIIAAYFVDDVMAGFDFQSAIAIEMQLTLLAADPRNAQWAAQWASIVTGWEQLGEEARAAWVRSSTGIGGAGGGDWTGEPWLDPGTGPTPPPRAGPVTIIVEGSILTQEELGETVERTLQRVAGRGGSSDVIG